MKKDRRHHLQTGLTGATAMGDEKVKNEAMEIMGLFQVLPRLVVFDLDYTLWPFYWYMPNLLSVLRRFQFHGLTGKFEVLPCVLFMNKPKFEVLYESYL